MKQKIFRLIHDFNNHDDFHRTYDRIINSIYIRQLIKRLHNYINYCSKCQLNQTKCYFFYKFLQSIFISSIFFYIINIDFILILSITNSKKLNNVIIVTCKFIKKIIILLDKIIWLTMKWINSLIIALMSRDWNISKFIVNDKNFKFMSSFWRVIFQKFKMNLFISTIYYFQINDQFEKTNQIIEIILRFWLSNSNNVDWIDVLNYLTISFNNVVNAIIDYVSNEFIYDFRVNNTLNLLKNLSTKNYDHLRQIKRDSTKKIIVFVNVMHKLRYDFAYKNIKLTINNYVFLRLHVDYIIFELSNKKLNQQRVDSFKILKKINILIYWLQLSFVMKIHSMIFIIQLKFVSTFDNDFYQQIKQNAINSLFVETKNNDKKSNLTFNYEIERLLNRRIIVINRINYLIK